MRVHIHTNTHHKCEIRADNSVDFSRYAAAMMGGPRAADAHPRTQSERLRVRGAELKRIYLEMDSGMISMDQFRAKLRALEIIETPATSRLLRDPPVSFTALLKSLATNAEDRPPPTYAAGHVGPNKPMNVYYTQSDAAHATRLRENFSGPRSGPARVRQWSGTAHAPAGGDVIAWRAPPRNTATLDDTREVCDVGVVAAGSAVGPRPGRGNKGGIGRREQSDIVRTILREENTDLDRMETHNQRQFREGLGVQQGPQPHSHHGEAHVMLRETIYGAVRELGAGRQTSAEFRRRLGTLGVEIPRAAQLALNAYDRTGRLKFNAFVRSFDEFFRSLQVRACNCKLRVVKRIAPREQEQPAARCRCRRSSPPARCTHNTQSL